MKKLESLVGVSTKITVWGEIERNRRIEQFRLMLDSNIDEANKDMAMEALIAIRYTWTRASQWVDARRMSIIEVASALAEYTRYLRTSDGFRSSIVDGLTKGRNFSKSVVNTISGMSFDALVAVDGFTVEELLAVVAMRQSDMDRGGTALFSESPAVTVETAEMVNEVQELVEF